MTEKKMQIKPYPLGAHREADSIRFSFISSNESCGILVYDKATGKQLEKIPFLPEERMGKVYCKYVQGMDADAISYCFYENDIIIPDEHARCFAGNYRYGKVREEKDFKAAFLHQDFDWEEDKNPKLPYDQSICYCMHVRGFTKHPSSQVKNKGTFLGIIEKIPYLKKSGITTLELQPAYEFTEIPEAKLNYWGYQKGYYYAPKAAYAAGEDAAFEFKTTVKELHKNNMEVIMQFYFPKDVNRSEIAEILHFWVLEYHVDGFHLMGDNLPVTLLAKDAALSDTKIWYYSFDETEIYKKEEIPSYRNLAEYRDDYLYAMRKFLKGDEDMLRSALQQMRYIPEKTGRIHYMSNYYGFTLMDMVSYDYKHNEENGEENRDGNDYNCSWNCGEEGGTRKRKVIGLRKKQLKNAMCMLLLTQSTPLIFMGDEFGNSQFGNNNPYCQDNKTTWLDWKELEKNRDIYSFWQSMVALRNEHPILRPEKALRIMDYIACGYPDLSYHGQNAWRPQLECYNRYIGIMYCGQYAKKDRISDDDFFYVAINMHWEPHELALPKLPKGMKWQELYSTSEQQYTSESDTMCRVEERSIVVLRSVQTPDEPETKQKAAAKRKQQGHAAKDKLSDRTIF